MPPPLLLLQDIHLTFGAAPLLAGAELAIGPRERVCVVGRNGSGKSTLLKIAAGAIEADRGRRFLQPGATLRYLAQEPDLSGFNTARAYVEDGLAPGDDAHRVGYYLGELGLTGEEYPSRLSGGEARRAALARVLASAPDILLLDEPTNHLDLPAIEWLENELAGMRSALVLISHDRRFLERLSRSIVWLDRGVTRRLDRSSEHFEAWRDEVLDQEERDRHKLDRKLVAEDHWIRYGVTARRKRNQGRMRALAALRQQKRDHRLATGHAKLQASEADTSGKLVVEADAVTKSFGDTTVVSNLSVRIQRGDRVGIVGANGAGKTTLLNLLTGALAPDEGSVRLGANVQTVVLDQRRASLDPEMSVRDTLTGGHGDTVTVGGHAKHVVGYMRDFLFAPHQAGSPVSSLSGGERGRLLLARALATPSNLLVLDEPTNDLDIETLDLVQEFIADYPGTVLLVSHDRDFLDRTVTSVLMAEGQGRWVEYAGGYADMLAQRGEGVTARTAAILPKERPDRGGSEDNRKPATEKRRLTFKDKHALDALPKRIATLEKEIAGLRTELADAGLYARDRAAFEAAGSALATAEAQLAASEDEWLRLEVLREELGGVR